MEHVSGLKTPGCPVPPVSQRPSNTTLHGARKELDWIGIKSLVWGEWESPRGKKGGGWDGIMEWGGGRPWSLLISTVPLLQSLLPGSLAAPSAPHPVSDIGQALRRYKYCLGWTRLVHGCLLSRVMPNQHEFSLTRAPP